MFKPIGFLQAAMLVSLTACAASPSQPPALQAGATIDTTTTATAPAVDNTSQSPAAHALSPAEQAFASELAQTRQVPLTHITRQLSQAQYNARVAELIAPSKTRIRRSWPVYRQRFVEPIRIRAGVSFWQEHQATLDAISAQYGVPASIIVAIIGVETVYGRHTGGFRVLDTLHTLAFKHPEPARPERVQMFREQLADLIELDYLGQLDASTAKGSFAGAMGLPQFMPGSLKRYARDGDGDHRIDLHGSTADAIASVANFLVEHGWQRGLPVFAPVILPADAKSLVAGGLEPTMDWPALEAAGARLAPNAGTPPLPWQSQKLGVIDLVDEPKQTAQYRVATPNFFAITHYNRSYFYAASVAELADALEQGRAQAATKTPAR